MGLFKRKKDEEAKIQLERESLDKLNRNDVELFKIPDDYTLNNSKTADWQISGKIKAPHTITAEELNANSKKANAIDSNECIAEEIPMEETKEESPSGFLYQKMMQSRAKLSENSIEASNDASLEKIKDIPEEVEIPASTPMQPLDINAAIDDLKNIANSKNTIVETETVIDNTVSLDNTELTNENSASNSEQDIKEENKQSFKKDDIEKSEDISDMGSNAEERRVTLLARCNAFLEDDSNPIKSNVEKYKLESVESILKGFETRAAERASKKFSTDQVLFVTQTDTSNTPEIETDTNKESDKVTENTIVFEKNDINNKIASTKTDDKNNNTDSNQVKHIFLADVTSKKPIEYEDISSTRIISGVNKTNSPVQTFQNEKTSVFPIVESLIDTPNSKDNILNNTAPIQNEEEKNNFDDYTGITDRQKILSSLIHNKKTFALKSFLSLLAFIVSVTLTISPIANSFEPNTLNIIDLIVCIFISITNFNVFSGISTLFSKKTKTCLPATLALISATVFSILNILLKESFVGFSSVATLTLLSYNYANKRFYSKTIKNFKLIADENVKNAISIIQNKTATKAIVGNAINGSSLVCYGGETTNVHNFLKYTYCKNPVSDKIQKLSVVGIIIGFILALAAVVLNSTNLISAFYIFTAAICFTSIPATYHIVSLTINSANKRLNHYDAMLTGYRAADELELCNGIAVSSDLLFPDGSIRLVDMKLLSPNPFDQSMLDAAAIATAIHSPLAGIFKQMDTSKVNDIPKQEVDSVIYEEKMGISGWVSDRRVFVGNRDLLIAHGFSGLPPAELDKKIMRKGYFPVYIASDNILCALLIVKYEPDENIIYELQRLANTGTTILVDNCDPNINEKMLADYFEVYDETIFVMSKQGSDYYKALISQKEHRRAGATYKTRVEGLIAALTASINIKRYVSRMSVFYVISVILGLLALSAFVFTSLIQFITPTNILLAHLFITSIMLLPAALKKP